MKPSKVTLLNPRTNEYEFLGPIGASLMITVLPGILYLLHLGCTPKGCPSLELVKNLPTPSYFISLFTLDNFFQLFDLHAFLIYIAYLLYLVVSWYLLPGRWIQGTTLRDGNKLLYKENGFKSLVITIGGMLAIILFKGSDSVLFISEKFIGLMTASVLVSYTLAICVYLASFRKGYVLLALGGNSGNVIYDFMIGRELNPRIGWFDIKYFVELRVGIFAWVILNITMAAKQYDDLGDLTIGMFLVILFQGWYAVDSAYNESAVLTTMDITTDGFGWMLSFGNISWLGFVYGLQTRYLAMHPVHLSWLQTALIVCIQSVGYTIFRSANNEKNLFRNDPGDVRVKHLKYITTDAGSRLIISGWWGRARHINYLGDWIMSWAWCLPCGFDNIFPYFYILYFAILLIHRELRDEEKCRRKYGKDWTRYCEIVRWRIIPGIY
ncbi:13054_t:CDS:2 [Ambispora gerdemannii]|uniref:Delta(14)-sterol reductase ERG24 n=1 Tax=Ambispora gerdemannii TaxID=144530 RepID=A0A9N8YM81_9GLOM|nr:13054_t:CDS:2 [Ambispora gerdemannii]